MLVPVTVTASTSDWTCAGLALAWAQAVEAHAIAMTATPEDNKALLVKILIFFPLMMAASFSRSLLRT
jgi:hypothetical protein